MLHCRLILDLPNTYDPVNLTFLLEWRRNDWIYIYRYTSASLPNISRYFYQRNFHEGMKI
jgi:hypothetical protein